jgi:hypothetical protein
MRLSWGISSDPGDDPLCVCAEQGKADLIVTLNPKDFPMESEAQAMSPGSASVSRQRAVA